MAMVFVRSGLALAALCLAAGTALADTPPMATAADSPTATPAKGAVLDPDRLVIARQIIAVLYPPDRASTTVSNIMDGILRPMKAQLTQKMNTNDPGLLAIFDDFVSKVQDSGRATLVQAMPDMTEAMARAYVRMFSRDDLLQILGFAQTPAGSHYLSRSTEALQDPDVQAYNRQLFTTIQAKQEPFLADFKARVIAYLTKHPDVAKAISQPH